MRALKFSKHEDYWPSLINNVLTLRPDLDYIDWPQLLEYINQYQDLSRSVYRRLVVNATVDPFDPRLVVKQLKQAGILGRCIVLSSDPDFVDSSVDHRYFPFYFIKQISKLRVDKSEFDWNKRTGFFSCLSRSLRPHRILAYYLCRSQLDNNNSMLSFAGLLPYQQHQPADINEIINRAREWQIYTPELESFYRTIMPELPISADIGNDWGYHNYYNESASPFRDCYAHWALETQFDIVQLGEKTTKPLRAGNLIIMLGYANAVKNIERMGFDLQYFDHSYDQLRYWVARTEQGFKLIKENYDLFPEIWHSNITRLKYNSELFLTQQLLNHCIDQVRDLFYVS